MLIKEYTLVLFKFKANDFSKPFILLVKQTEILYIPTLFRMWNLLIKSITVYNNESYNFTLNYVLLIVKICTILFLNYNISLIASKRSSEHNSYVNWDPIFHSWTVGRSLKVIKRMKQKNCSVVINRYVQTLSQHELFTKQDKI